MSSIQNYSFIWFKGDGITSVEFDMILIEFACGELFNVSRPLPKYIDDIKEYDSNGNKLSTSNSSAIDSRIDMSMSSFNNTIPLCTTNITLMANRAATTSNVMDESLKIAILYNTEITEISSKSLESITRLDISNMQLTNLNGIGDLENLEVLNVAGNAITNLAPISELSELKELNISGNGNYKSKAISRNWMNLKY